MCFLPSRVQFSMFSSPTSCPHRLCEKRSSALLYIVKASYSPAEVSGRCRNRDGGGNEPRGSELVHPEPGRHWEEMGQLRPSHPANVSVTVQGKELGQKCVLLILVWKWSGAFAFNEKLELS